LADPHLAWLCGVITAVSIFLTVGKTTYDWPSRLKFDTERVNDYSKLRFDLQHLKEDAETTGKWGNDLEKRFVELRRTVAQIPQSPYKQLSLVKRRNIQNEIKNGNNYKRWWLWQD
jgi:hypothetical protein